MVESEEEDVSCRVSVVAAELRSSSFSSSPQQPIVVLKAESGWWKCAGF